MKAKTDRVSVRAVLLATSAWTLVAGAVTFPQPGGDISLASNWPDGVLPNAFVPVVFDRNGTYVAQEGDVAFSNVTLKATSSVFDFSTTPARVVTCAGKGYEALFLGAKNATCALKGGYWQATKSGSVAVGYKSTTAFGNTLTLDGADLSDFNYVYVGYSGSGNGSLVLTNNASVSCKTRFEVSNNGGGGNRVEVNAGSIVTAPTFYTDVNGTRSETSGRSKVLVRGQGAAVNLTGDFVVGVRHDGNDVRFTDGASLSASALNFGGVSSGGSTLSTDNKVLMDSGATARLTKGLVVGDDTSGNRLVLSNATMVTPSIAVGNKATASNNLFRVTGMDSSLTFDYDKFPFAKGLQNAFEVADGAAITTESGSCIISSEASGNVIRLLSGGVWKGKNVTLSSSDDSNSWGNRIEVGAGAKLDLSAKLTVNSHDNVVVVSNGTLRTTSNNAAAIALASVSATNNTLRLEGATPAVRLETSGAGLTLYNGTTLEFVLPPGGYSESHVPITASYVKMDESSSISIDSSLLDTVSHRKLSMVLCQTTSTPTFPDAVINRANESLLPRGMKLSYASKKLTLTAKGNQGLVIFFK